MRTSFRCCTRWAPRFWPVRASPRWSSGSPLQSTLGNLVAGVSITIYRPFRLGDTLQLAAPTGTEIGTVELISLGYTTLRAPAGHLIVVPNSVAASQVILNLNSNTSYAPWPLLITIVIGRDADIEATREMAVKVAGEKTDAKSIMGWVPRSRRTSTRSRMPSTRPLPPAARPSS